LPTIGPWFYGPDPGPCTETGTKVGTYAYDDAGRVLTVSFASSVQTYSYADGALSSISGAMPAAADGPTTYAWTATAVTETLPGTKETIREYLLDAAGYPTELWVSDPALGTRRLWASYQYVDCRLMHRDVMLPDGSSDSSFTADYDYDALGHLITRTSTDGTRIVYDCSCW
jgi:YD repeat-containing protein